MVNVIIKEKQIIIKGHANFDEFGKDIVCASISSIVITSVNGILRINNKSVNIEESEGSVIINLTKDDSNVNLLLENMISLLQELKSNYPKNIIIRNEVEK